MLKVLAAVFAVLSAAISITIYTATLPAVQKKSEENAAAIETLGGSVSDNAEAIETLEGKHIYVHYCKFYTTTDYSYVFFTVIDNDSTIDYTKLEGKTISASGINQSDGKYFTQVTYSSSASGMVAYKSLAVSTSIQNWTKDVKTVQLL